MGNVGVAAAPCYYQELQSWAGPVWATHSVLFKIAQAVHGARGTQLSAMGSEHFQQLRGGSMGPELGSGVDHYMSTTD
jgi:hypothetical protein